MGRQVLRTLALAIGGASLLIWALSAVVAQDGDQVNRFIDQMPAPARKAVEAVLRENGVTLDDVRSNPALAAKLMSSPEIRQRIEQAMAGVMPKSPASSPAKKEASKSENAGNGKKPSEAPAKPGAGPPMPPVQFGPGVPEHYRAIGNLNVFRRLGWAPPGPQNPFTLVGIVESGSKKRALLGKQGSQGSVYVAAGEDAGNGYRVARIDSNAVVMQGNGLPELRLELDIAAVASTGGGAPPPTQQGPAPAAMSSVKKPGGNPGRWYPNKGAPLQDVIMGILKKEGLTMQQVENDKALQEKLRDKYSYLEEEGYAKFPRD
ncbi:hypothetical protein FJZ36_12930 [Candidatus Poribacteria bacterium]|nr:hypothetical protein [Candidatus Poribacteria bacterium]